MSDPLKVEWTEFDPETAPKDCMLLGIFVYNIDQIDIDDFWYQKQCVGVDDCETGFIRKCRVMNYGTPGETWHSVETANPTHYAIANYPEKPN